VNVGERPHILHSDCGRLTRDTLVQLLTDEGLLGREGADRHGPGGE
jgi:hypothetical protein